MVNVSSLSTMSVDALLGLRDQIGAVLSRRTAELRSQLQRLDGSRWKGTGTGKAAARKGGKIPPKYRDPDDFSNVWAGRGARPRWMEAKIRAGAKQEDFLISTSESGFARKRSARRLVKGKSKSISRKQRHASARAAA